MELGEFVALFLREHEVLVANWHKKKKGFNRHDAKSLAQKAVINMLTGKRRSKLGRPRKEDQKNENQQKEGDQSTSEK